MLPCVAEKAPIIDKALDLWLHAGIPRRWVAHERDLSGGWMRSLDPFSAPEEAFLCDTEWARRKALQVILVAGKSARVDTRPAIRNWDACNEYPAGLPDQGGVIINPRAMGPLKSTSLDGRVRNRYRYRNR